MLLLTSVAATVTVLDMPKATTATRSLNAGLGESFRILREGAGLGIRPLAERSGISAGTISRWERGEREISRATYEHLSAALADYVAGGWAA